MFRTLSTLTVLALLAPTMGATAGEFGRFARPASYAQKASVQKHAVQKGHVQKGHVQKGHVQKAGPVQKGHVQRSTCGSCGARGCYTGHCGGGMIEVSAPWAIFEGLHHEVKAMFTGCGGCRGCGQNACGKFHGGKGGCSAKGGCRHKLLGYVPTCKRGGSCSAKGGCGSKGGACQKRSTFFRTYAFRGCPKRAGCGKSGGKGFVKGGKAIPQGRPQSEEYYDAAPRDSYEVPTPPQMLPPGPSQPTPTPRDGGDAPPRPMDSGDAPPAPGDTEGDLPPMREQLPESPQASKTPPKAPSFVTIKRVSHEQPTESRKSSRRGWMPAVKKTKQTEVRKVQQSDLKAAPQSIRRIFVAPAKK